MTEIDTNPIAARPKQRKGFAVMAPEVAHAARRKAGLTTSLRRKRQRMERLEHALTEVEILLRKAGDGPALGYNPVEALSSLTGTTPGSGTCKALG